MADRDEEKTNAANETIEKEHISGSLEAGIVAATKGDVQQGDYYGPDGPDETGGFPALAVIDDAALDNKVANRLWSNAQEYTGIIFP